MVQVLQKDWDAYAELRGLMEKTPDLSQLYRTVGYTAGVDRETEQILQDLKTLLCIEIPDYSKFQEYVARVQIEIEKCERGEFQIPKEITDPKSRKLWEEMAHPLFDVLGKSSQEWKEGFWRAALEAKRNKSKLDNVVKMLETPYSDEWGGYMVTAKDQIPLDDDSFVVMKITDESRFAKLLDQLHRRLLYGGSFVAGLLDLLEGGSTNSDAVVEANCHDRATEAVKAVLQNIVELQKSFRGSNVWVQLCDIRRKAESIMRIEYDLENQAKKQQLDSVLIDVIRAQHEFATEGYKLCEFYRGEIVAHANEFLNAEWMHLPWLRDYLLTALLDTYLAELVGTVKAPSDPNRWTSELPPPWGVIVPSLLSVIFFLGVTAGIVVLFEIGISWLAYLGIIYLVWHYSRRFYRNFQLAKRRGMIDQVASLLQLIRDEVKSGHYQPEEISRRLRQLEEKNCHVHSLVFPLLNLAGLRPQSTNG